MNPNAGAWKPSVSAASWAPPTPTPAPASTPAPAPPKPTESTVSDETDPLWEIVLKIANGDVEKATRMIQDPDSLVQYPEVAALLASGGGTDMDGAYDDEAGDTIMEGEEQQDWEKPKQEEELVHKMEQASVSVSAPPPAKSAKPQPVPQIKEDELMQQQEDTDIIDPREHFNLVFIGHVDAGKSTLSGNILYITENVDKRTIERYEREAKERNRESWFLAFIMDTNEEERAKGKTVEVGRAQFNTEAKRYTIMDAPGHKNYVPNMIMGASQADIAVLVISARKGEFETGFDRGGQTREHALLAKTLGVSYLVVAINKMDEPTVQWKKERFDECVSKLRPFLKGCGFKIKKEVKFLPVSALTGANIKDPVDTAICPWWSKSVAAGENNTTSPTLIGLLDSLTIEGRDAKAALRLPILDRYKDSGTIAMGKVESGTIRVGQKITLMPTRMQYKIDKLWADEKVIKVAKPGENILIKLKDCSVDDVLKGFVICSSDRPCRAVNRLICEIYLMDLPDNCKIFTNGFKANFHAHTCEEEAEVVKLFETTNMKNKQTNKKPAFANIGFKVVCMIEVARSVPVETYDTMPFLGRITLRTEGKTIAIGKIIKLPPKQDE
jgi:peptide chain release factor subunit 3